MAISNDTIRRKRVDISFVKQSGTLKYDVHVMGAVSKKMQAIMQLKRPFAQGAC